MPDEITDKNRFFELLERAGAPRGKSKGRKGAKPQTSRDYTQTETEKRIEEDTSG